MKWKQQSCFADAVEKLFLTHMCSDMIGYWNMLNIHYTLL